MQRINEALVTYLTIHHHNEADSISFKQGSMQLSTLFIEPGVSTKKTYEKNDIFSEDVSLKEIVFILHK